jgi:LacI family transcriptional regulator
VRSVADQLGYRTDVAARSVTGGDLAACYLGDLGHRAAAELLAGPNDVQPFIDRAAGFARGAAERRLSVVPLETDRRSHPDARSRSTEALLARKGETPTAMFVHNDAMAIGALASLGAHGMDCPRDISVLGFDDTPFIEHLHPPLSTIGVPGDRIGETAAELALSLIEDPDRLVESLAFPPTVVARESTGPPSVRTGGRR